MATITCYYSIRLSLYRFPVTTLKRRRLSPAAMPLCCDRVPRSSVCGRDVRAAAAARRRPARPGADGGAHPDRPRSGTTRAAPATAPHWRLVSAELACRGVGRRVVLWGGESKRCRSVAARGSAAAESLDRVVPVTGRTQRQCLLGARCGFW